MDKERLLAFTDGVIAVIITIMVLEMKVPQDASLGSLRSVIPVFLSYVLSFVYVAIYWNNHHHFFHLVRRVNGGMLWANINLLFWVSLVPFATGWMGSSIGLIKKEKPMDTNAAVTLKERLAGRVARYAGRAPSTAQRSRPCHPSTGGRRQIGMAEIKSESVADFIPESVADFPRNTQQYGSSPDSPLEEGGFEPSVPLLRKALLGVANRRRRHERRSHLQVQVRDGDACLVQQAVPVRGRGWSM